MVYYYSFKKEFLDYNYWTTKRDRVVVVLSGVAVQVSVG